MKNKGILLIGSVIVVIITVFLIGSKDQDNTNDPVKIGIALPLSGPVAFLGEPARNAAIMAMEDMGKTKYEYELVIEDDAFDPKQTATVVTKFTSVDKTLAMITFGSGTANVANPIAESAKVVQFALASDPTAANGDYNFVHWTPAFTEGELLADEIVRRGYKTVSIVDTNHAGALAVTNAIKNSLSKTDVEIVTYDLTNVEDKDFRTIIQKIKLADPDIIILEQFSPAIEVMTKQLRDLGVDKPITSVETIEWSSEPELFERMWFVSDSRMSDAFVKKYSKRFDSDPKAGATYVYDLVQLIVKTQESSDHRLTPEEFAEIVSNIGTYDSETFGPIEIDSEGFFITEASVKEIKDGKVVALEK